MDRIEVYSVEDRYGNAVGSSTTRALGKAKEFVRKYRLRLIAPIFEFADTELVEDNTGAGGEETEDDSESP